MGRDWGHLSPLHRPSPSGKGTGASWGHLSGGGHLPGTVLDGLYGKEARVGQHSTASLGEAADDRWVARPQHALGPPRVRPARAPTSKRRVLLCRTAQSSGTPSLLPARAYLPRDEQADHAGCQAMAFVPPSHRARGTCTPTMESARLVPL